MEFLNVLSRDEMKNVKGGARGCSASVTCPNGRELTCSTESSIYCHQEGDGTYEGYINCGVGRIQLGCWNYDMGWLE
jgi:hypothetical protein|tara:strand:- start:93555 stop:93785 length:231 start_codon:yes stop_codon:yes gene_type:complete